MESSLGERKISFLTFPRLFSLHIYRLVKSQTTHTKESVLKGQCFGMPEQKEPPNTKVTTESTKIATNMRKKKENILGLLRKKGNCTLPQYQLGTIPGYLTGELLFGVKGWDRGSLVAQASLVLIIQNRLQRTTIPLPLTTECWNYRHITQYLVRMRSLGSNFVLY